MLDSKKGNKKMNIKCIILAAGQGTRMKSDIPKVLHQALGMPLIHYPIQAAKNIGAKEIGVIIGHQADKVKNVLGDDFAYYYQTEQLGTGHAVMQAIDFIEDDTQILILCGDVPLITSDVLQKMINVHSQMKNSVTVLSAKVDHPYGYGRIARDTSGKFVKIVEEKDATKEEKAINEINGGIYIFEGKALKHALSKLTNNNVQKEYYLTDTIEILMNEGHSLEAVCADDSNDILGVNSREQLAQVTAIMQQRINKKHMDNGVTLIDPNNTYIGSEVSIGQDTIIEPGCMIQGGSKIGSGCIIGFNSKIINSTLGDNVDIESSVIKDSFVDEGSHVGPFAYLRPNSHVGKNTKIGDFVEIKNSTIGNGTKISHLTYVGDADVGENVNFGCGTVVVNYDGKKKYRTTIKDNAFIGCNTNLVAPVVVEEGAYTAAGSTITKTVPKNSLAIARARQENKEGWVQKKINKL